MILRVWVIVSFKTTLTLTFRGHPGTSSRDNLFNLILKKLSNNGAYIVETYHPLENGEEEVAIYLPIQ
ncbi:hypothetical protein [Rossellomorea aquimaris]|uniref:hypothetical protein n=1 Tax=Rossellomorea aquimaris TaxID=189382 RepID=UPI000DEB5142|nr:hypothetical protein [Rossellomorea aquimaris]